MKIATSRSGLDLSDLFLKKGSVNWKIFKSSSSSNLLPEKFVREKLVIPESEKIQTQWQVNKWFRNGNFDSHNDRDSNTENWSRDRPARAKIARSFSPDPRPVTRPSCTC